MKKVLIVTYYWPPSAGSGVQRWLKFAKYLPEFGWQPVVYTPENPDFPLQDNSLVKDVPEEATIVRKPIWEPYSLYRSLLGKKGEDQANFGKFFSPEKSSWRERLAAWIRGNFFIPDPRRFWVGPSVRFLSKYLTEQGIQAIVTTGPPHSMHLIGLGLKKRLPDLFWIADMRDPWADMDMLTTYQLSKYARNRHLRLEKEVLDLADKVVMVSPRLKETFQPFDTSKLAVITNGFDEADIPTDFSPAPSEKGSFRIYHTGLLNGPRNPVVLWEVLEEACREDEAFYEAFELHLIGKVEQEVREAINQHPRLREKTRIENWLDHSQLVKEYQAASLLLVLLNNTHNAGSHLPGKLFEYLALRKPILLLAPVEGDATDILKMTQAGGFRLYGDPEGMREIIREFFEQHQKGDPKAPDPDSVQVYSRKNLTGRLVELLAEEVATG